MVNINNKICVVLVTYNRLELLKECLNSLNQNENIAHIVIVNNNSTDGTNAFLNSLGNEKYIIKNCDKNIGGAGGFALGIQIAYQKTQDKYFWIMDDDTIPNSDASRILMEKAEALHDRFGFLCSNVRWTDGSSCNIPKPTFFWPEKVNEGLISVAQGTFVSVLFSRFTVKKIGLPTKELFIWGDDTEYTIRLSGEQHSYFVTDSLVTHKTANNLIDITILNDSDERIERYYYLYRNLIYIKKRYFGKNAMLKLVFRNFLYSLKVLINARGKNFKRFRVILHGTCSGIFFNPKIQYVD